MPEISNAYKSFRMHIKVLGAAAGGGFPQWNCACQNCAGLRAGTLKAIPRTQTQIAFTPDGELWFLVGASPDLRVQIESTPELHPREGLRQSPIAGVVLAIVGVYGVVSYQVAQRPSFTKSASLTGPSLPSTGSNNS